MVMSEGGTEEPKGTQIEPEKTKHKDEIEGSSREEALLRGTILESNMENDSEKVDPPGTPHSFGFYAIVVALCFTGLLTALETTITSTALPTIIAILGGDDLFIWVVNTYYLTM
jgi:hypothetical protein